MRSTNFKLLFFVVCLLGGMMTLPVMAQTGACCNKQTYECDELPEMICTMVHPERVWLGPGTDCSMCRPMQEEPSEPALRVGDWLTAEPWHNWISANEVTHVQLHVFDPCELIYMVNFYYYIDGYGWELFYSDSDGSEPTEDTTGVAGTGNGWSGYLPPGIIPVQEDCSTVYFKAEVYWVDSFFDVYAERIYDFTPPDSVTMDVNDFDQTEEDHIYLDVDPDLADIATVYYDVEPKPNEFSKGIPKIDQHLVSGTHCAPTAAAACLKYFESQGDGDICGGQDDEGLIRKLGEEANTNKGHSGTYPTDLANGLRDWIADNGGGYTVRGPLNHFDWKEIRDELERCQDVLVGITWPSGGGHRMTLNSVVNKPLPNGKIKIDFMDPWTGEYQYGELDPASGYLSNFDSTSGPGGELNNPIIICPEEDDPSGGGGGAGWQPGPDPGGVVIPLPNPGLYRITVTVVDTFNNAATVVRVVERIGREFGDAPEGPAAIAYPSLGVTGSFPTCINAGPAGWIQHNNFGAWFGPSFDFETEGNAGWCPQCFPLYDQDECFNDGDAGLIMPEPYTIVGMPLAVVPCPQCNGTDLGLVCQTAIWGQDIDIHVHNWMPGHEPYVPGFVNVLVDWDQNGAWGGSSVCPTAAAPEHVLVNFVIPPQYDGPLSGLMPAGSGFLIGPNPGYVWVRFSITEAQVPLDWNGEGSFEDGETEDYLLSVSESECFPSDPSHIEQYYEWLEMGKPECWCSDYGTAPHNGNQCRGDAAGDVHVRGYIVYTTDLTRLSNSWKAKIGDANLDPCADMDHQQHVRGYRVYTGDLNILSSNWKAMALPNDCPRTDADMGM